MTCDVNVVDWRLFEASLTTLRFEVFVEEQGVPVELELDEDDPMATHVAAWSTEGAIVGTGRILDSGKIGRMAVRSAFRGRGIGGALLDRLVNEGRRLNLSRVYLGAQLSAVGFYRRYGFSPFGKVFPDAGIDHQMMELFLSEQKKYRE